MGLGKPGDGLGEAQRGALASGEERCLPPRRQGVQALLGLADGAGVLGVHVDAVGAAVELRGADADQLAQPVVDAGGVELLGDSPVELDDGPVDAGSESLEVEASSDRGWRWSWPHGTKQTARA